MNRDIIPLLDNDVLSLIGKEVIKIRDRKTLEYWIELYKPSRRSIINRLYPDVRDSWWDIHGMIRNFNRYIRTSPRPWFPIQTKWDVLKDWDKYGTVPDDESSEEDYELEPMTEEERIEEERLYREGFGSPDSDGAY